MDNGVILFTVRTPLDPEEFSVKDSGGDSDLSDSSLDTRREGVKKSNLSDGCGEVQTQVFDTLIPKVMLLFQAEKKKIRHIVPETQRVCPSHLKML